MKALALGLLAALAVASAARADDEDISDQAWDSPKFQAIHDRWPKGDDGRPLYGRVFLDCTHAENAAPTDCRVKVSEPSDSRLEKAALALAPLFKGKGEGPARAPLVLAVMEDSRPDWLKKPTLEDLLAVYPGAAYKQGVSGRAVIKCTVQTTGLMRACRLVTEDRPGLGFGPAAIVMSRTFLFKPAMRAGQPVEAEVTIPIAFKTFGKPDDEEPITSGESRIRKAVPPPTPTTVLGEAVWSKTPTVADILGEINKKVGDKFAEGQVVFQCRLDKKSGKLSGCVVANVSPGMDQFRDVAKSLVPKFQADPDILASAKGDVFVNLAFAFPNMSSPEWGKRYLTHPRWTRALGPDSKVSTFPEAAIKAGLRTGSATVDCVVAASGALTHCETIRESAPNVGFGPTAIEIAQTFAANPWDENGLPVDGAHVRMPVEMDYEPPEGTPTPATKP